MEPHAHGLTFALAIRSFLFALWSLYSLNLLFQMISFLSHTLTLSHSRFLAFAQSHFASQTETREKKKSTKVARMDSLKKKKEKK